MINDVPPLEGMQSRIALFSPPGYRLACRSRHGGKKWLPLGLDNDPAPLMAAHAQGHTFTATAETKAGKRWQVQGDWLGVYSIRHDPQHGPRCTWCVLDIDLVAGDHAQGLATPGAVDQAANIILDLWKGEGLSPVLERSHSGTGWHVWVLFPWEVPAPFSYWLGNITRDAMEDSCGIPASLVESFPKSDGTKGQWGNLVALPLPGLQRGHDGGRFFTDTEMRIDHPCKPEASNQVAVRKLMGQWEQWNKGQEQRRRRALLNQPQQRRDTSECARLFDDISCEEVARAVGSITKETQTTIHLDCPHHDSRSGASLHVDRGKEGWWCFSCGTGGGSFTLARWLIGDGASADELAKQIRP
jgi:hypothetical protein